MRRVVFSILADNTSGVLSRISGLFSRRGYNIDSLTVGTTADPRFSRITVVSSGEESILEQIEKQLNKLVDVIKVRTIDDDRLIGRELMIVKVSSTTKTRTDIMNLCQIMGAKILDVSPTSMTLELSDTTERLELFQSLLRPFSILEVARTGLIAVQKGSGKI